MYLYKTQVLNNLKRYRKYLVEEELSKNTIERYIADIYHLLELMPDYIRKENLILYKEDLKRNIQIKYSKYKN